MKDEFKEYCESEDIEIVELDDDGCVVDLPRSAERISKFLANSPVRTDNEVDLLEGLEGLIAKDGLKLLEFGNWQLSAEPTGGIPPKGGMLRLTVKF